MNSDEASDNLIEARIQMAVAKEKVMRSALSLASTHFVQKAEDPGWDADMYEDFLDDAIQEYVIAKEAVDRILRPGDKGRVFSAAQEQALSLLRTSPTPSGRVLLGLIDDLSQSETRWQQRGVRAIQTERKVDAYYYLLSQITDGDMGFTSVDDVRTFVFEGLRGIRTEEEG